MQWGAATNKETDLLCWRQNQLFAWSKTTLHVVKQRWRTIFLNSFQISGFGVYLCWSSEWAEQIVFSPCLAERTPVRGLLFDFPYVLEFFLLSRAVCGEGKTAMFDERFKIKATSCTSRAHAQEHQFSEIKWFSSGASKAALHFHFNRGVACVPCTSWY